MIVNAKRAYSLNPVPGARGISGWGLRAVACDDSGNCFDVGDTSGGTTYDPSAYDAFGEPWGTVSASPGANNLAAQALLSLGTSGDAPLVGGATIASDGSGGYAVQTPSGQKATGLTVAQASQLLAAMSNAATSAYKSTLSPYQIPGTSLVYNPATGQMVNPAGIPIGGVGTGVGANPLAGLLSGGMLPILLIAVVALSVLGGKK